MMLRQPLSLVTTALVVVLALPAAAQTRTWSDSEFTTWTCTPLFVVNGSTVTCSQEATGGNPGATYRVQHDVTAQGSIGAGHTATDPSATFDPVTEGPFGRIELAFDVNVTQAQVFGGVVAFLPIIEQGGVVYYGDCLYDLVSIQEGWTRLVFEFAEDELDAGPSVTPRNPDLAGGAPFTAGIYTGNSTCCGGGVAVCFIDNFEVTARVGDGSVGTRYCVGGPVNSSGRSGVTFADGSDIAAGGPLRLRASCLPDDAFGYFIGSTAQGMVPNAGGSAGTLCLSGSVGRFNALVQSSGHGGWFAIDVDTLAIPQPTGTVAVQAGETWNFQCWHRDLGSTSNFTSAVSVMFQ